MMDLIHFYRYRYIPNLLQNQTYFTVCSQPQLSDISSGGGSAHAI